MVAPAFYLLNIRTVSLQLIALPAEADAFGGGPAGARSSDVRRFRRPFWGSPPQPEAELARSAFGRGVFLFKLALPFLLLFLLALQFLLPFGE